MNSKVKPHNIAYTTLHNWELGLQDPEFKCPLKGHVVERIITGINSGVLSERHDLKRLDNCVLMMKRIYTTAKERNIPNIQGLPSLRQGFIDRCLEYFNRRITELRFDIEVVRKKDNRRINVSLGHIKKYEERIKIYKIGLQYPLNVDTAESK